MPARHVAAADLLDQLVSAVAIRFLRSDRIAPAFHEEASSLLPSPTQRGGLANPAITPCSSQATGRPESADVGLTRQVPTIRARSDGNVAAAAPSWPTRLVRNLESVSEQVLTSADKTAMRSKL